MKSVFEGKALRSAIAGAGVVGVAAGFAGAVRLLPWWLDPAVTLRVAVPFARGVLALAGEAAIVVGWPVGWAIAAAGLVERGEARALATLGLSPVRLVARLLPQAAALASLLAVISFLGGRDASEPGRVVSDLIARGHESCAEAVRPTTYAVPFAAVTWLCAPGARPRLAGRGPGALDKALFTAAGARVTGDLREVDLDDARIALGSGVQVRAGAMHLRGLPPFGHASTVPPLARALALAASGVVAGCGSVLVLLWSAGRRAPRRAPAGRAVAIVLAAAGSLTALGAMRWIDRTGASIEGDPAASWLAAAAVPGLVGAIVGGAGAILSRLPARFWTASK